MQIECAPGFHESSVSAEKSDAELRAMTDARVSRYFIAERLLPPSPLMTSFGQSELSTSAGDHIPDEFTKRPYRRDDNDVPTSAKLIYENRKHQPMITEEDGPHLSACLVLYQAGQRGRRIDGNRRKECHKYTTTSASIRHF